MLVGVLSFMSFCIFLALIFVSCDYKSCANGDHITFKYYASEHTSLNKRLKGSTDEDNRDLKLSVEACMSGTFSPNLAGDLEQLWKQRGKILVLYVITDHIQNNNFTVKL